MLSLALRDWKGHVSVLNFSVHRLGNYDLVYELNVKALGLVLLKLK